MAIKSKPCKECGSIFHTKMYHNQKKPIRSSSGRPEKPNSLEFEGIKKQKPRKKTESRSQLIKKLDSIYSKYIRLSWADSDGYCICVTSGARIYWKEIQNGHFYSRKYLPTRWNNYNCHPQSVKDNVFLRGNYIVYTKYMIDTYGREFVDQLEDIAKSGQKITTPEIREKISYYLSEVKQISLAKGIAL